MLRQLEKTPTESGKGNCNSQDIRSVHRASSYAIERPLAALMCLLALVAGVIDPLGNAVTVLLALAFAAYLVHWNLKKRRRARSARA